MTQVARKRVKLFLICTLSLQGIMWVKHCRKISPEHDKVFKGQVLSRVSCPGQGEAPMA